MVVQSKIVRSLMFLGMSLFILTSCWQKGSTSYTIRTNKDVQRFVKDQQKDATIEKKIKEVNYTLKFISNEQMALQQIRDISQVNQQQFDSVVRNYDGFLFFNLEIAIDGFDQELVQYKLENSDQAFNDRVDYYAFQMQKDVRLVMNEKDTIPCVLYHYERNYGISPNNNFMIGFKVSTLKNLVFIYDNQYLNTGTVKFTIEEKKIVHHPHIKIS